MTDTPAPDTNWQEPSLIGLRALDAAQLPGFEVLLLDDLAAYVMGAGPLVEPFTVEHGSRVVSALFGAIINSARYVPDPDHLPVETPAIATLRASLLDGAHALAAAGEPGLVTLVNRLVPAAVGELELHKDDPAEQTRSLFYYALLAVASGPMNLLSELAAEGAAELFLAWDAAFGNGLVLPWRQPSA